MPATHCAVPGCNYDRKKGLKRSLFTIRRPELAKNEEDRAHRTSLTNFILSIRDATKQDNIKHQLHKESYVNAHLRLKM